MFQRIVSLPQIITCIVCKEEVDLNTIQDHVAANHPELANFVEPVEQLDDQLDDQLDEPQFGEDDSEVSEVQSEESSVDSYGLMGLFFDEEAEVTATVGRLIHCDWCTDRFADLSSAITHVCVVHPFQFYVLAALPAVEPPGAVADPAAAVAEPVAEPLAAVAEPPAVVEGSDDEEDEEGLPAAVLPYVVAAPPNVVPVAPPDIIACIVCNAQVDRQLIYAHFAAHHPDLPAVAPPPPVVAPPPPEGIIACIVCRAAVEQHMMDDHFLAEHQVIHVHVVNADEFHFLAGPPAVEQAPAVEQPPPPPAVPHNVAPVIISCLVCRAEVDHQMIQDHFIAEHPNLIWNPPPADLFVEEEELDVEDGFGLVDLFEEEEELDEEQEDGFGLADLFEEEEELDEEQEDGFGLADLFVEEEEEEELEEEAILNFYNF